MKNHLRSFNVDYNWHPDPNMGFAYPAEPSLFAKADAKTFVDFYKKVHANCFWTFSVGFNGYAWFDSKNAPKVPGLKGDFLNESVELGHKEGMDVFAYLCVGDNNYLRSKYPEMVRCAPENMITMVNTDRYCEYLEAITRETIEKSEVDGIVYDWFRYPRFPRKEWCAAEKELYHQLMGETFPGADLPVDVLNEYERRCIDKAWQRVKYACRCGRKVKIWTNHPFEVYNDPIWNGSNLLKEADYILNESPDFKYLEWLSSQTGEHTRIVQNICGWSDHKFDQVREINLDRFDLFGFAQADPEICLPTPEIHPVNWENIQKIQEYYSELENRYPD